MSTGSCCGDALANESVLLVAGGAMRSARDAALLTPRTLCHQ
jgi:hypothetical protein